MHDPLCSVRLNAETGEYEMYTTIRHSQHATTIEQDIVTLLPVGRLLGGLVKGLGWIGAKVGGMFTSRATSTVSSKILSSTPKQLQKKFNHASDFGVSGNYNKANAANYSSAINQHINSSGVKVIQGTYRGNPATHYINPQNGLNVISSPSGNFVSGWKLNTQQLQNVVSRGKL